MTYLHFWDSLDPNCAALTAATAAATVEPVDWFGLYSWLDAPGVVSRHVVSIHSLTKHRRTLEKNTTDSTILLATFQRTYIIAV